jgi:hypothetical protein
MEQILLFIKHNLGFIWIIIERVNDLLFYLLYHKRLDKVAREVFKEIQHHSVVFKRISIAESASLYELIRNQPASDLTYFKPHSFEFKSIVRQTRKPSFLMMGAFINDSLVGYFFLRLFVNRKCFVGRLIDKNYRGHGIGVTMNRIMYEIAWRMKFRCLSTISRNNHAVIKAHSGNRYMSVLKELKDDYLLVEFLPDNHEECVVQD